jgi:hypothetical protein
MKSSLLTIFIILLIVGGAFGGDRMEKKIITGDPRISFQSIRNVLPDNIPLYSKIVPSVIMVGGTPASLTTAHGYFMDLRGIEVTNVTRRFTADYIVVRDNSTPPQTIGLADIDETNNISLAGPIAGGRDQVAAFNGQWIHLFIIYNPDLQLVSSLSSLSPTSPTLPSGYIFFMRVGSAYISAGVFQGPDSQMGEVHYYRSAYTDLEPAIDDTYEDLSISGAIPPTAKMIFGYFGLSKNALNNRGMAVASDTSASNQCIATLISVNLVSGYVPSNAIYFTLPILTSQQMSWKGSPKTDQYAIIIQGYIDDL